MQHTLTFDEKHLSQLPALHLLMQCGYTYLSPEEALVLRGGKPSNVLLEEVLRSQLPKFNKIHFKGETYHFSEANIQEAVQKLKNIKYDGLLRTNEAVYDLISLGTALEQSLEGSTKSFTLQYIDWQNPSNNVFHVTAEYSVERSRSLETARPDIVLFVNGIPLAVIECKAPHVEVEQGISQMIRNQGDSYIPRLFTYAQVLMSVNKNAALYGTAGTPAKFWGVWDEKEDREKTVQGYINKPLSPKQRNTLFCGDFAQVQEYFDAMIMHGERLPTVQDKALYSLCRPERLLELSYGYTLFDGGIKKIARYQQFFVVREALKRVKKRISNTADSARQGGIIWHTQGSGKSLTMVMLARALVLDGEIENPRIVLVTDREDLDKQLGNTFTACGLSKERAASGRNLVKHLKNNVGIITTLMHKFDKGWTAEKFMDTSSNIFVLVDESHRTNFGSLAARMRQMLPNACYLGFTGTPLLKKEKNSMAKFGGLIAPQYPIRQAVADKAVLPLLYEGRHVEMLQNQQAIDLWFARHTEGLSSEQQADLKRKYAKARTLNETEQVIYMRAFDISEHYRAHWQGTGFKAQLVAPSKPAAVRYHAHLKDIGYVSSEIIISGPDSREGHEEVDEAPTDAVIQFWQKMMQRYGNEEEYTSQIINQFKYGEEPEILIVVSKLLTGFDAPRNTVLYLCNTLKEHTLLQAIARVNRLEEGKDYGYIIDYASVLGELDKALTMYDAFSGYDEKDIVDSLISVHDKIKELAQQHSDVWDIFKEIKNKSDAEAFELLLADEELREIFYERLSLYGKTLGIALGTESFLNETDERQLKIYKDDLRQFQKLKLAVKLRYAESIDYRDYEPKIKKLLDTHIQAHEVTQLNEPVDIFDEQNFASLKEGQGVHAGKSTAAKADTIAHATKKVINEKMDEDPSFYEKFSKLIQQAIDAFRAKRISDMEYLQQVSKLRDDLLAKSRHDVPQSIAHNEEACAYYGIIEPIFMESNEDCQDYAAETALAVENILHKHWKVDFWNDADAQKAVVNDIDDYLYDVTVQKYAISLSTENMDTIIEKIMHIAQNRRQN